MGRSSPSPLATALVAGLTLTGCGGGARSGARDMAAYEAAVARNHIEATEADVRFVSGMIPHHAQAVLFAGWAGSHQAGRAVRVLCERIVVAQRDEIETMRNWLRDQEQPVPAANATHARMVMDGMEHDMLMPGMLTDQQLAELDAARGDEFDRLFLSYMIGHHAGAVTMVDDLFTSYGGAQSDFIYKLASDIYADQTSEIERMQKMLDAMNLLLPGLRPDRP